MTSILKVDTIQDADGNNIINESSNATVGASGDTVIVPSGATLNVAGTLQSGGSALVTGMLQVVAGTDTHTKIIFIFKLFTWLHNSGCNFNTISNIKLKF